MNEGGRRGGEEPRKGKLEDEARGNKSPRRSGVACMYMRAWRGCERES